MINLSMAVFPADEPAPNLDAIARMPLWRRFRLGHGTGHGVGYFLMCIGSTKYLALWLWSP